MGQLLENLRIFLRRWLGVAQFQKRTRARLDELEKKMAISQEDLDRLNAATSRIAARVTSLLDQVDALGTGNDDQVRQAQQVADVQEASSQLRPVLEQLESLGADATNVVPTPDPGQVPVEPGPDVPPVENVGTDPGTAPVDTTPVATDPAGIPVDTSTPVAPGEPTPAAPGGDTQFDPSGLATGGDVAQQPVDGGGSVPTTDTPAAGSDGVSPGSTTPGNDGLPGDASTSTGDSATGGAGTGESVPGPVGDDATPTQ